MFRTILTIGVVAFLVAFPGLASSAGEAGDADEVLIGHIRGPFPSSFVDALDIPQDAVCQDVKRWQLSDGGFREVAKCQFLPGASLPTSAPVTHDETNSAHDFWSDFIYETTGQIEPASSWSVRVNKKGAIWAESFYVPLH